MSDEEHRSIASRSRRRWIAGSLLLALLFIIGYCLRQGRHPAIGPPRDSELVDSEAPVVMRARVMTGKPRAASPATTLDICGLGKVPLDTSDPSAADRYIDGLTAKARSRWLATLLDSDDIRARAAGLLLQRWLTASGPVQPIAEQTRDALVQLAVGAGDPAVYAMAVYACDTYSELSPSGSCQQITLQHWSAIDADNAVPWLLLAGKAHTANDVATEAAAFGHAAGAHRADAYNFSLYSVTESALPGDVTPLERWILGIALIGIESATGSLQYGIASRHCSTAAMQDPELRQQCDALAGLLVSKGTTLLDQSVGTIIGTRAGWPQRRTASLVEEHDALMQVVLQTAPGDSDDMWSCEAVQRGNAYLAQRLRLGELGAVRDTLERSGETVPELAAKHRDFLEAIRRDAQRQAKPSQSGPPP
jgi:hypothetical protein